MWIVMTSSAKMPSSVRAVYRRVAVVKLSDDFARQHAEAALLVAAGHINVQQPPVPKMISTHAIGCVEVREIGKFPGAGKTERSGLVRAMKAAEAEALRLNQLDIEKENAT